MHASHARMHAGRARMYACVGVCMHARIHVHS